MAATVVEPTQSFSTDLPAAALEFCPVEPFTDVFVTGTYKLHESDPDGKQEEVASGAEQQTRSGRCLIYQKDATGFRRMQELDFAGILDLKWNHAPSSAPLLGVADSIGQISILNLSKDESSQSPRLSTIHTIQCGATSSTLCLSLDWSNRRGQGVGFIATSLSDGVISVLRPSEGAWDIAQTWKAHEYEPWVVAFDYWNENVVYSGGDDLTFRGWDIRACTEDDSPPTALFKDKKSFSGGVTSIQSSPHDEHILAVGR